MTKNSKAISLSVSNISHNSDQGVLHVTKYIWLVTRQNTMLAVLVTNGMFSIVKFMSDKHF